MLIHKKTSLSVATHSVKKLGGWHINAKGTEISKTFVTPNFVIGLALLAKVTVHAEILGHHPTVELSYDSLKIKLTTHEVKGLTKLDFELAKRIDALKIN